MERKGVCKNVGVCSMANKVQIITDDDAEFICPECHEPLEPYKEDGKGPDDNKDDKNKRKRLILIGGGIAVVALAAVLVIGLGGKKKHQSSTTTPVEQVAVAEPEKKAEGGDVEDDEDELEVPVPQGAEGALEPTAEPGTKEGGAKDGTATGTPEATQQGGNPASGTATSGTSTSTTSTRNVQNGHGTVNLGYGTYTGDLKNGKPHGHGTIKYTKSHKIVPSKEYVASPGDTFEGDFRDGVPSGGIGYWTHNGDMKGIKL